MQMNKRGLVMAITAAMALSAAAAQAGVEIYGKARVSLDYITNNDPNPANKDSTVSLSSNVSRLGFKGDEDLGNGLSALWQIESQVDFDTGTAFSNPRNTFVGLSGGFGMVTAGRNETAYRIVTNRLDPFSDTKADYNAIIGNIGGTRVFDNRTNNLVSYASPDLSGLKVQVSYSLNRTNDDLRVTSSDSKKNLASIGGGNENGPLYVVWDSADRGGANGKRDAWYLSAAHKIGDNTLKAAVAMADDLDGASNSGATQFSIGGFHALSKNTEVYALYTVVSNDTNGTYGLWSGSQAISGFADESVSALSIGLNHNFSSK